MATRRVVPKPEKLEPVKRKVELTGVEAEIWACPACGFHSDDLKRVEQHIETHGGESL